MTHANPPATPLSQSKSAALTRVLDLVTRGYTRVTSGRIPEQKLLPLLLKFHERYGIGCSPAQRITRKKQGLANAALVLFQPSGPEGDLEAEREAGAEAGLASGAEAEQMPDRVSVPRSIEWLLLVTAGGGQVTEAEALKEVTGKPNLVWLGYELVRYASRGKSSWTWRRTKAEMADWYALLGEQLASRRASAVATTLQLISRQPGFSGVRRQGWELMQFARSRGYAGELPFLFHLQKIGHGRPVMISALPD